MKEVSFIWTLLLGIVSWGIIIFGVLGAIELLK